MKYVIWGTGYYASLFTLQVGRENVDFYLDNSQREKVMLGKPVVHPKDMENWAGLHIYVPYNYYDEISTFLRGKGLQENIDFSRYTEEVFITQEQAAAEYQRAMSEADLLNVADCCKTSACCGRFWLSKDSYHVFLRSLLDSRNECVVITDTPWYTQTEVTKKIGCQSLVLPTFIHEFIYVRNVVVSDSLLLQWEMIQPVKEAAETIQSTQADLSWADCLFKSYYTFKFMNELLRKYHFKTLIMCGSDMTYSKQIRPICVDLEIPLLFTHPGLLPGTITVGPGGDIGDSIPAVYNQQFKELPLHCGQVVKAKEALGWLYNSRANRKVQPKKSNLVDIRNRLKPDAPIVLCMGQNDPASSMIPYTRESYLFQSPIFKSSVESTCYLAGICAKYKWNVIYKPHPMYARFEDSRALPDNVIYVPFCDVNDLIDMADVVVTIRSSINYIALIRRKPVLMLGYTQTRGQGCTYEAFTEQEIEVQLRLAVQHGFTEDQQNAFLEHVARLLQYYLYDDMSDRAVHYGLPWPAKVDDFFALEKRLEAMATKENNFVQRRDADAFKEDL